MLTMVYAKNQVENRRTLWNHLTSIRAVEGNTPWVLMGDFNYIRTPEERM